jgi:PadR family transcriptional regulator PadR
MTTQGRKPNRIELLQGTLDVLILRTLQLGRQHGQGIARAIQKTSEDSLLVDHGSLYPALKRLEKKRWVRAEWGVSSNNRRARFYDLTPHGQKQLEVETTGWYELVAAMGRVLGPQTLEGE